MEWLMNASFFPEQLKHCMCGLPEFGRQGRPFLLFCCVPLQGFPWWTWAREQWEDRGGGCFISVNNLDPVYPPIWKWRATASDWEAKETEQARPTISLEITLAWHFNYHLLPEDSFVQSRMKPALALTCNAKWWMALSDRRTHSQTFASGGIHQGSRGRGAGPHLPGAGLSQTLLTVYSPWARASVMEAPTAAAVFSLPVRCDGESKGIMSISFLTICRWSRLAGV